MCWAAYKKKTWATLLFSKRQDAQHFFFFLSIIVIKKIATNPRMSGRQKQEVHRYSYTYSDCSQH